MQRRLPFTSKRTHPKAGAAILPCGVRHYLTSVDTGQLPTAYTRTHTSGVTRGLHHMSVEECHRLSKPALFPPILGPTVTKRAAVGAGGGRNRNVIFLEQQTPKRPIHSSTPHRPLWSPAHAGLTTEPTQPGWWEFLHYRSSPQPHQGRIDTH
ncbi:hypothetical protein FQA47_002279 [Oryzias melastigma]|uniref:Uncharacterized protein n=1 Tax=Oryzias melastigma TaxID=30732 RepID=A0A834C052_ORYME|nr:hypothetical protein FQA47_002279 [Oryzias melastigma]